MQELKAGLWQRASELGFHRMGVARAGLLDVEGQRLREWLAAGYHGGMGYMKDSAHVRVDPTHPDMLRSALSVVVLATAFARTEEPTGFFPGRIARYAQGRDYHNILQKRARKLAKFLRADGFTARPGVDQLPLFERAWAERSGVGFIGKNCCLIVPGLGSHVFLTLILTSAELPPDEPIKERCGSCTRCLDACPTQAFVESRRLDARRCISYLTIEERGVIAPELMEQVGSWMFGCDACQDVCPFNRTKPLAPEQTSAFAQDAARLSLPATDLLGMGEEAFAEFAQGSPLKRAGRAGLARNAAIVLGNSRQRRYLPVLQAARTHDSELVRDAAAWAVEKLEREPESPTAAEPKPED